MSRLFLASLALLLTTTACSRDGQFEETGGVYVTRSACPAFAVPVYTGDITTFTPENSTDASAIDVTASITNVRGTCTDSDADIVGNVTFDVLATRTHTNGARQVVIPYFISVMRGGSTIASKKLSSIVLNFADGQARASAAGTGQAVINRAEATLPESVRATLTRKRRSRDADAAIDPMATPEVKDAVARSTFEVLVGFQLTQRQLGYNATR